MVEYRSTRTLSFYLTRAGSSTPLEIDIRAFRQIRVFWLQQGGEIAVTFEVWENGERIGTLGSSDPRDGSAIYDTPGRTLRVRIDSAGPTNGEVNAGAYTALVPPPLSALPPPPPPPVLRLTIYGTPG